MIICRSPLRISLGGGGTDLPSYYEKHGGFVVSAAINRYVYVTINEAFRPVILLKYSKLEEVETVAEINHPMIREAMKLVGHAGPIDLANLADIPAGTGMGSSGSFATALLLALHTFRKEYISPKELAEQAYHLEHDIICQPVGKQDQYISAIGGITEVVFNQDGSTSFRPLCLSVDTQAALEDNLLLFFTGYARSASGVLEDQDKKSRQDNEEMIKNLHVTKELGVESALALEKGNLKYFAELMSTHWRIKRKRSEGMSNGHIDELYQLGMDNGALGGKLVGAGAGGFLMFYAEDKSRLRSAMHAAKLKEIHMRFDFEGTQVMVHL